MIQLGCMCLAFVVFLFFSCLFCLVCFCCSLAPSKKHTHNAIKNSLRCLKSHLEGSLVAATRKPSGTGATPTPSLSSLLPLHCLLVIQRLPSHHHLVFHVLKVWQLNITELQTCADRAGSSVQSRYSAVN